MSEPFLGEIRIFGFNFNPRGWAFCDGQLLPIAQNSALFSLLGTIYGGDGRTTFALPDLRSRVPAHEGQGPGLSNYPLGSKGGAEYHTLNVNEIPPHNHSFNTSGLSVNIPVHNGGPNQSSPSGNYLANVDDYNSASGAFYGTGSTVSGTATIGNTGGGQSFNIRQPYLTLNFCIALQGIFPSRS